MAIMGEEAPGCGVLPHWAEGTYALRRAATVLVVTHRTMTAVARSVIPAVAILASAVLVAVLVAHRMPKSETPGPWIPPSGFEQVAALNLPDTTNVALWAGWISSPKPGNCWHLVETRVDEGYTSVGGCGGPTGPPWVVRRGGVIAGSTGEDAARWVRLAGGNSIAVHRGYFLTIATLPRNTVAVELLDASQERLAYFGDVPVGGDS